MTRDPFNPFSEVRMYTDMFLKFADQAEADSVLFDEQTAMQGDVVETIKVPKYDAIDVIGTIYKPTGEMLLGEDGKYPEMEPVPGWHVNVRHSKEAPELAAYSVQVNTPVRVWA